MTERLDPHVISSQENALGQCIENQGPHTIEVYKWIVLALSISLDFWLRWLVHEA
jgi:hypothetical protein